MDVNNNDDPPLNSHTTEEQEGNGRAKEDANPRPSETPNTVAKTPEEMLGKLMTEVLRVLFILGVCQAFLLASLMLYQVFHWSEG
jgi:hypothetical protein